MRIIFFGTPHFVIPVLQVLEKNFQLVGIVTAPDRKAGRKQLETPSPIRAFYLQEVSSAAKSPNEIPIFTPSDNNLSSLISHLSSLNPDLFVVAAYGKLLPKEILEIPPFGAICIHPSLLPKYRGPSPVPQTLLNGEKVTGTTIIKMDEKMDHGPILSTELFEIHETDTYETLMTHLFNLGANMLPDVINNYIAGKIDPQPQDDTQATFTKLLTKKDGYIDPENPPNKQQLEQMTRAYFPWPGVWTVVGIKNFESRIKFLPNKMIQVEGKKVMNYKDFINGYPELKEKIEKIISQITP